MPTQRFLIAPYDQDSGKTSNVKPWIIPDTAFEMLENAYVFRGRVRKRIGSRYFGGDNVLLSRLRVKVATTALNAATGTVPGGVGAIGQMFSIGMDTFTVYQANGTMLINGTATIATFNTATGVYAFTGVSNLTDVFWYPALPVMGILQASTYNFNQDLTIAFDTRFAYKYNAGWERLANADALHLTANTWKGTDDQLFWGTSWTGELAYEKYFFVTNFNTTETDFMRFFTVAGAVFPRVADTWYQFHPVVTTAGPVYIDTCLMIVTFHNRLICLNTIEDGQKYTNRAAYSWIGDPTDQANAFLRGIPGNGGSIDAATAESIVSCEFIRNRLIVYFDNSTWEIVYQGNQGAPFTWQQLNTELGSFSTYSITPFDKIVLAIGSVGIHACNGANVERIDTKIPKQVFDINQEFLGPQRVYGIRDYGTELVYWTFPNDNTDANNYFPNKILSFNYRNGTWALFDDSITAFGYYQLDTSSSVSWDSIEETWDDPVPWDSGSGATLNRSVACGNQEGFTFLFDAFEMTNARVLQITNVVVVGVQIQLVIINHNLKNGDFIYIKGATWDDASNALNNTIFMVQNIMSGALIDPDNIILIPQLNPPISIIPITGNYTGGGYVGRVSKLDIKTKEFNFFAEEGRNAYIPKVDFMVDKTAHGQVTVDYFVSTNTLPLLQDSITSGVALGNGILETSPYPSVPFEADATRLWHPVYFQADGEVIQFEITMSDDQMYNILVYDQDFQMHAMMIHADKTSNRFQ